MSHIAIDARILSSTTGTYVERLITYLEKIDTDNDYSILIRKKDIGYWAPSNKRFTVRVAEFDNYSLSEQIGFKKYLDELAPDLVHFCMPQQPVFYKGNHVTTVHDLTLFHTYNSDKNWLVYHAKQLIGRFVFKNIGHTSTHIITPTLYTKEEYVKFASIPPEKVTVTYEAADVAIGELQPYAHPFERYILYVGQQSDYKNIKRLGEAHQKLLKTDPDLGLILVGNVNAAAQKNKEYFEQHGFKNIVFTGFLPNSQRDWLYTHASAYVFPSLLEGFGLPGLEAMGYGAPVVSSNATCLPEVYGDAAAYFNPLDVDDIAQTIRTVLQDSQLTRTLKERGYKKLATYSWERMAKQTHAIYMDTLSKS